MKKCIYCGSSRRIEQDHVRASSKGGKTTKPACRKCNRTKGSKSVSEYFTFIRTNKKYKYRKNRMKAFHKGRSNKISKLYRNS